jgi:hypothetical protein
MECCKVGLVGAEPTNEFQRRLRHYYRSRNVVPPLPLTAFTQRSFIPWPCGFYECAATGRPWEELQGLTVLEALTWYRHHNARCPDVVCKDGKLQLTTLDSASISEFFHVMDGHCPRTSNGI